VGKKCVLQLSWILVRASLYTINYEIYMMILKKKKKTERERVLTEVMIASNHIRKKKLF